MPLIWLGISAAGGLLTGLLWESETEEPIVKDVNTGLTLSWWDKTLMAAAGIAAYYIWKRFK